MPLTEQDLVEIETLLAAAGNTTSLAVELRGRYPGLTVTQCDPFDLADETPFRSFPGVVLHLLDRSDHCWRLTMDAARATGLVLVAQRATA